MDRRLTILTVLILALLISIPSFICGWLMSERQGNINLENTMIINSEGIDEKVDINKSTKSELMTLPGIGDKKADLIMLNRNYNDIYELVDRGIIGEDVFSYIRDMIKI